jgi:hypothetical protein
VTGIVFHCFVLLPQTNQSVFSMPVTVGEIDADATAGAVLFAAAFLTDARSFLQSVPRRDGLRRSSHRSLEEEHLERFSEKGPI